MDDREQAAYDEVAALWKSTLDLVRARPGITTSQAAEALIRDAQWVAMEAPTRLEVRMALGSLRGLGYVRCTARGHSLSWSLVPLQVLCWDKAPKAQDPAERAQWWGGGIPGAYAPNMDEQWMARWKARLAGQRGHELRVEVRKTTCITRGSSVQVLLVAWEDGQVGMSMNGTAEFSPQDWADMQAAVGEARAAMAAWRAEHPQAGEQAS